MAFITTSYSSVMEDKIAKRDRYVADVYIYMSCNRAGLEPAPIEGAARGLVTRFRERPVQVVTGTVRSILKRSRTQMSIALSYRRIAVPKDLLHLIQ